MMDILTRLSEKKTKLDAQRPLPPAVIAKLKEYFDVEWTYHSNAIEGNTLTLAETRLVIQDGLTVNGKSLREHLEAINHKHAIDWVEAVGRAQESITEHTIRQIHALVLRTIDDEHAGRYRRAQVYISGSTYVPPQAIAVPPLMQEMVAGLNSAESQHRHPVERAALAYFKLVHIHPFVDGNGRTARLLMNLILMQAVYPPAVIRREQRAAYYDALDKAHAGDTMAFVALVAQAADRSLDMWLKAAVETFQTSEVSEDFGSLDWTLVFDGGSRGNPGPGYGSYALQLGACAAAGGDESLQVVHLEFGKEMTNNEAEYEALIRALEDLRGRLTAMGADPEQCEVTVQGDSRLVINQVTGTWKAREPRMLQRRNRVRGLLRSFGRVLFEERTREEIEEVVGH